MFTLQAAQIETALRGAGVPDLSAKEMMQGVANCQVPLEHRGPVAFTHQPQDNSNLLVVPIAEGSPDFYAPPSTYYQPQFRNQFNTSYSEPFISNQASKHVTVVNIPPWQNVPWTPLPYPNHPEWQPIPYPDLQFPPIIFDDPAVLAGGPVQAGPLSTPSVDTKQSRSEDIFNDGDIVNGDHFTNYGPSAFHGDVHHNRNVVNQNNVINNNVVNRGPVVNKNIVHNRHVHNHRGVNHGRHKHFGPNQFFGSVQFGGDVWMDGNVYIGDSSAMAKQTQTVVTDVEWTGSELRKKTRSVTFLGYMAAESTTTVVSGAACPTQPVSGPASNFVDSP